MRREGLLGRALLRVAREAYERAGDLIPESVRPGITTRIEWGRDGTPRDQWLRDVMAPDTERVFESLVPARLEMVEISGANWAHLPWAHRAQLDFPQFDLCDPPDNL